MAQSQKDVGRTHDMLQRLQNLGIDREDAWALRRISMTLHRWHELECGDSNDYASWTVARGHWRKQDGGAWFEYDDDGESFLERHSHSETKARYTRIPDRERGAQKRLAKIMARYPTLTAYVQGDPRGCALYILKSEDIKDRDVSSIYSSFGVAVHK